MWYACHKPSRLTRNRWDKPSNGSNSHLAVQDLSDKVHRTRGHTEDAWWSIAMAAALRVQGPLNKWVSGQNYRVAKHDASLCIIILGCILISRIMKVITVMIIGHYHTHEQLLPQVLFSWPFEVSWFPVGTAETRAGVKCPWSGVEAQLQ